MKGDAGGDVRDAPAAGRPARCPRCGSAFDCGAGAAAPCACESVELPAALLSSLRARFSGCLCLPCLRALGAEARPAGAALTHGSGAE